MRRSCQGRQGAKYCVPVPLQWIGAVPSLRRRHCSGATARASQPRSREHDRSILATRPGGARHAPRAETRRILGYGDPRELFRSSEVIAQETGESRGIDRFSHVVHASSIAGDICSVLRTEEAGGDDRNVAGRGISSQLFR